MANLSVYIDPDAVGGADGTLWADAYVSTNLAEAAEQQDLTDAGGDVMHFYWRSSSGGDDTTAVLFDGWGTSAGNNIVGHMDGTGGSDSGNGVSDDVNGIADLTKYFLDCSGAHCVDTTEFVDVIGLQGRNASGVRGLFAESSDGGTALTLNASYCVSLSQTSGTLGFLLGGNAGSTMNVWNCVIYSPQNDGGGCRTNAGTMNCYNVTVRGFFDGFNESAGTMNCYNCVSFLNVRAGGDFNGVTTIENCASDDAQGNNPQTLRSGTNYSAEFTDSPNGDFSLPVGSRCIGNGVDDPAGDGKGDPAIDGTARNSTWDIGAWELAAVGGATPKGPLHHPLWGALAGPIY